MNIPILLGSPSYFSYLACNLVFPWAPVFGFCFGDGFLFADGFREIIIDAEKVNA